MNNLQGTKMDTHLIHLQSSPVDTPLEESFSDSRRSSARNSNLNNKYQKSKILIERRHFDKLINFLKILVKELNIEEKELKFLDEFIQTEGKENFNLENGNKGDFALELIEDYDTRIRVLEQKISSEQEKNLKLIEDLKLCNKEKEEAVTKLEDNKLKFLNDEELIKSLRKELELIKKENEQLKDKKEKLRNNYSFNNFSQFTEIELNSKQRRNDESLIEITDTCIFFNSVLINEKQLFNIASYLKPLDYFNLSHSSKKITNILNRTELTTQMLKYSIWYKNILLNSNKDFAKEYEISEFEIERLLRDYIQNEKIPGIDLKNQLLKALSYIEKEIKTPLGLTTRTIGKFKR
jgi:hypothetical protein